MARKPNSNNYMYTTRSTVISLMKIILSSYIDEKASFISQSDHLFQGLPHVLRYDLTDTLNCFMVGPKKTVDEPNLSLDVAFLENCVRAFIS